MKKALKVVTVSAALVLASSFAHAHEESIAYINSAYVFQNHPDRQAVAAKLEAEFKAPSEKIIATEKVITDKITQLQQEAPKLRSADIQKREAEINKLRADYETEVQTFQQESNKRQDEERLKLLESIQVATNSIAADKKYTLVLDANSIVYAPDALNISEEVLKTIKPATTATGDKK